MLPPPPKTDNRYIELCGILISNDIMIEVSDFNLISDKKNFFKNTFRIFRSVRMYFQRKNMRNFFTLIIDVSYYVVL